MPALIRTPAHISMYGNRWMTLIVCLIRERGSLKLLPDGFRNASLLLPRICDNRFIIFLDVSAVQYAAAFRTAV